jgi:hypothetical protein
MGMEEMNAAGKVANAEFAKIFKGLNAAEKKGVQVVVDWLRKHKNAAGYKLPASEKK